MSDPGRARLKERAGTARVVVKVGSGVLVDRDGRLDPRTVRRLANEIAPLVGLRRWPFVVSSGAIAVGMAIMGLRTRPRTMPGLQAAAAIGQSKLVEAWSAAFRKYELNVAQVLLTHADLADRRRFLNARRALAELERRKAVAVINENDTVSFEEIAVGDNDELAAHVSNLVDGDLLILLSVAPGVLDQDGIRIPVAQANDPRLDEMIRPDRSRTGVGGMLTKLRAARIATSRGAMVAIVPGKVPGAIQQLVAGEDIGTLLMPGGPEEKLKSRAHWIAHTLRPSGVLVVDGGARAALTEGKKSLLPSGIVEVIGRFGDGDPVEIAYEPDGTGRRVVFARGLARYSADHLRQIAGLPSGAIEATLGFSAGDVAVHRDDIVLKA